MRSHVPRPYQKNNSQDTASGSRPWQASLRRGRFVIRGLGQEAGADVAPWRCNVMCDTEAQAIITPNPPSRVRSIIR